MSIIKRVVLVATVTVALTSVEGQAKAAFITYTETVTGTGTLGSSRFNDALITLTTTADSNNVTFDSSRGLYQVVGTSGSVTIAGVGSTTFSSNLIVFSNTTNGAAGIEGLPAGGKIYSDILDTINTVFKTYDLKGQIGPITGSPFGNSSVPYATNIGSLVISSMSSNATFTASSAAVPEPSSLAMCGLAGLVGLAYTRARRGPALA